MQHLQWQCWAWTISSLVVLSDTVTRWRQLGTDGAVQEILKGNQASDDLLVLVLQRPLPSDIVIFKCVVLPS